MHKYFFITNKRSHAPSRGRSPLIQAVAWVRLIPSCRPFATVQAVSRPRPKPWAFAIDSGRAVGSPDSKV